MFQVYSCDVATYCAQTADGGTAGEGCLNCYVKDCGPPGSGRTPAGLIRPERAGLAGVAAHWVLAAHAEEAAVLAFERMVLELKRWSAPSELVDRAALAAVDERRHAACCLELARREGGRALAVVAAPLLERPFFDFAAENALAGCVEETWGAAVVAWQAEHATDAMARDTLRAIAADELSHAELSWDVARWAGAHLSDREAGLLRWAERAAIAQIAVVDRGVEANAALGLPTRAEQHLLHRQLRQQVWPGAVGA